MEDMMQQVTKEQFFAAVGPINVHPRPERDRTVWETPSREVIGISTPGYLAAGDRAYWLNRLTGRR